MIPEVVKMIKVEKTPPFHQHNTKHHNRQNNQRVINRMGWHRVDTIERIPLPNTKLRIPLHKPYQWYNIPRHNAYHNPYQWYDTTLQCVPVVRNHATIHTKGTIPSHNAYHFILRTHPPIPMHAYFYHASHSFTQYYIPGCYVYIEHFLCPVWLRLA